MAWTKSLNETQTARAENADLELRFFFGDALASPPNALRAELSVKSDRPGGVVETAKVDAAVANISTLTAGERTTLQQLLAKCRDAGLAALGYTQT